MQLLSPRRQHGHAAHGRQLHDCHAGFKSVPGTTCWTCHAPGQDTSTLSSPATACSQSCHLFDATTGAYDTAFTHGATPHLGASGFGKTCLDCHSTSTSVSAPGASPHHGGVTLSPPTCADCHNGTLASAQKSHDGVTCESCHTSGTMTPATTPDACYACHAKATFGTKDCLTCHASAVHTTKPAAPACTTCHQGFQKHAGKVACTTCHSNVPAFHHGTGKVTTRTCRSCHAVKHAGKAVPASGLRHLSQGHEQGRRPRCAALRLR